MAEHRSPDDRSFSSSLARHVAAGVALVVVVAAAFWGIGNLGDGSSPEITAGPGTTPDVTATSEPVEDQTATATEDPATVTTPTGEGPAAPTATAQPTEAAPTDEATDEATDEPAGEATEDEVTSGGEVDPAEITVQILDATGGDGSAAAAVARQLRDDGFPVVAENKAVKVYDTTTVFYTPGNEAKAEQIAAMYGYREVAPEPGNLSHTVDVHLVVGTDA